MIRTIEHQHCDFDRVDTLTNLKNVCMVVCCQLTDRTVQAPHLYRSSPHLSNSGSGIKAKHKVYVPFFRPLMHRRI